MIWHWTDILISVFVSWVGRKENVHFCNVFFMHSVSVQIKLRQWTEWHLKIPSESWYHLFKCYQYTVTLWRIQQMQPFLQVIHWFCGSPKFRCGVIYAIGSVTCAPGGCQECSYTFNCVTIGSRHNKNSSLDMQHFTQNCPLWPIIWMDWIIVKTSLKRCLPWEQKAFILCTVEKNVVGCFSPQNV